MEECSDTSFFLAVDKERRARRNKNDKSAVLMDCGCMEVGVVGYNTLKIGDNENTGKVVRLLIAVVAVVVLNMKKDRGVDKSFNIFHKD